MVDNLSSIYDDDFQSVLWALFCSHRELSSSLLNGVLKELKITKRRGDEIAQIAYDRHFLTPPLLKTSNHVGESYYGVTPRFTYYALVYFYEDLEYSDLDLVCSRFRSVYEQYGVDRYHQISFDEYALCLSRLFARDPAKLSKILKDKRNKPSVSYALYSKMRDFFMWFLCEGINPEFFGTLDTGLLDQMAVALDDTVHQGYARLDKFENALGILELYDAESPKVDQLREQQCFLRFLISGHPAEQAKSLSPDHSTFQVLTAIDCMSKGDYPQALKFMRQGLKLQHSNRYFKYEWQNWFYGLCLYLDREDPKAAGFMKTIVNTKNFPGETGPMMVYVFSNYALSQELDGRGVSIMARLEQNCDGIFIPLLLILDRGMHLKSLSDQYDEGQENVWLDSLLDTNLQLKQMLLGVTEPQSEELKSLNEKLGMKPLFPVLRELQSWEKTLDRLILEHGPAGSRAAGKPGERTIFFLELKHLLTIIKIQKSKDGISWSNGRVVKPAQFVSAEISELTPQDRNLREYMHSFGNFYNSYDEFLFGSESLEALIGHPRVYSYDRPSFRYEITRGRLQMSLVNGAKGYKLVTNVDSALNLKEFDDSSFDYDNRSLYRMYGRKLDEAQRYPIPPVCVLENEPGHLEIIRLSEAERELISSLKAEGTLPPEARGKLTELLELLSESIPVMSDLLRGSDKLDTVEGDSSITLRITQQDALYFELHAVVRPSQKSALACRPGVGQDFMAVSVDGRMLQIKRDRKSEKANFSALSDAINELVEVPSDDGTWMVVLDDCLKVLELLKEHPELGAVEWPEGEKLKLVRKTAGFGDLKLSVRKLGSWFELDGELQLDSKTRLEAAELLRLVRESSGNFIRLGDNEYAALTAELKKQLAQLARQSSGGKNPRLSVFSTGTVEDFVKHGAELDSDASYHQMRERISKAAAFEPELPRSLKAELRDYQEDGFKWMSRLAAWGAGAVLADDMGLGKTVQTITLMLSRSKQGPQLVVVPASLMFNWRDELTRFAPSLKVELFNLAENRSVALKRQKSGHVLITTYGVMSGSIDELSSIQWATAVLDEAHNIKNRSTHAFKAAVQLKADFRVLLTGTPLQNHLSEIWALYEFAVPGLLGSYESFSERFVLPVERDHDKEQQRLLKRIVSPFMLRRTKESVLNELPEKTEITLKVELSKEELAVYEQLRQEASVNLESGEINPVQALAALMKLRQAACSTELIDKKLKLPSSKTAAFMSLVDELISGGHRALVFSQFTSHLALIRRELDARRIEYLYLDGSMSAVQRRKLVEGFEAGEMPLFLISLKAGGTGLNLTAADYVVHLDPWWNPAIEDQASDRAYRIGQERPVTIYRLIARNTVEEKILKLHSTKKSLADALLEGSEMSSRLGREEIMELLRLAE